MNKREKKKLKRILIAAIVSLLTLSIANEKFVRNVIHNYYQGKIVVNLNQDGIPSNRDKDLSKEVIDSAMIRIIDGDTFENTQTNQVYRLYMIDTPETCLLKIRTNASRNIDGRCNDSKKEEPDGYLAALYLKKLIASSSTITIESDGKKDKYNRVLTWVFVEDKYLVQALMSQEGFLEGYYTSAGIFTTDSSTINLTPAYVELVAKLNQ